MAKTRSGKTWLATYLPVAAEDCPGDNVSLLRHALRKWKGLRPAALKRHNVAVIKNVVRDVESGEALLRVTSSSCGLCIHYVDEDCRYCPLAISRGDVPCDETADQAEEDQGDPFHCFINKQDPKPMIAALTQALEQQLNGSPTS